MSNPLNIFGLKNSRIFFKYDQICENLFYSSSSCSFDQDFILFVRHCYSSATFWVGVSRVFYQMGFRFYIAWPMFLRPSSLRVHSIAFLLLSTLWHLLLYIWVFTSAFLLLSISDTLNIFCNTLIYHSCCSLSYLGIRPCFRSMN